MIDADVVIVGGRPSGASLAARLGAQGLHVIVVDRAELPSLPSVPSCPILYPQAMQLLDEIGVEEASYADDHARIESFCLELGEHVRTFMRVPAMHGRSYAMGIDRATFDAALWESLARHRSVERRSRFAVTGLLRDASGRVMGVEGRTPGGGRAQIRAHWTVGADGRYSLVAREAGAKTLEDWAEKVSTVYFADWEDLASVEPGRENTAHVYASGRGAAVLFFPGPRGRTAICTHMRADRVDVRGDAQAFYLDVLRSFPGVRRRIEGARQVGRLLGMKRVGNRYLQHGGPGWALVGDALHHKDPVDGQGIYDALLGAKLLADAIVSERSGGATGDQTLERYRDAVIAATRPMFLATMKRLERELYEEPPELVVRTLLRWLVTDPAYQDRFLKFLGRMAPPDRWLSSSLVAGAVVRGIARDLRLTK